MGDLGKGNKQTRNEQEQTNKQKRANILYTRPTHLHEKNLDCSYSLWGVTTEFRATQGQHMQIG